MRATWDPTTYLQFADHRARPFYDLVGQVGATEPAYVVDLGCGPGQLTASLRHRWPGANLHGIDSSPAMIEKAQGHVDERLSFSVGDVADWTPDEPVDVIISNATLQWVPGHRELLPRLADTLSHHGWLAFQVPGNFDAPSHSLLYELARDPRFAPWVSDLNVRPVVTASQYLADLTAVGLVVDAWETTYLHVLDGPDPVFRWISGTGARPILQALPEDVRADFIEEYQVRLRVAYPAQEHGTVLPFRRIFVVAHRP